LPGAWVGISTRTRNDSIFVSEVDYESPAWQAGIRRNDVLIEIDHQKPTPNTLKEVLFAKQVGATLELVYLRNKLQNQKSVPTKQKSERSFPITHLPNPTALQQQIFQNWSKVH
jgi:C-terminal processing protease CtpA/Prc